MATTSHNLNQDRSAQTMIELVTDRLRSRLVDKAIEAIRPDIKEQVEVIVKELEPRVRTFVDYAGDEMVVQLLFNDPSTRTTK